MGQQGFVDGEVGEIFLDREALMRIQRLTGLDRIERGRRVGGVSGEGIRRQARW